MAHHRVARHAPGRPVDNTPMHTRRAPRHTPPAAFTIVEVLVVVAIVAILAAVVVPRIGSTAPAQLSAAAQMLSADIAYAQAESIAHSDDPRVVVIDMQNNRYHIAKSSDPSTPITEPVTQQPYAVVFGQGRARHLGSVTLHGYALGGDDTVTFGPYGQVADQTTPARITLAAGSTMKIIMISLDQNSGSQSISDVVDAESSEGAEFTSRLTQASPLLNISAQIGTKVDEPLLSVDLDLDLSDEESDGLIDLSLGLFN